MSPPRQPVAIGRALPARYHEEPANPAIRLGFRLGGEIGRRTGLKILGWVNHRTGSIPVPATELR